MAIYGNLSGFRSHATNAQPGPDNPRHSDHAEKDDHAQQQDGADGYGNGENC